MITFFIISIFKAYINSGTCCSTTLVLDTNIVYQKILGFGGAVSDAAAINWKSLHSLLRDALIKYGFFGFTLHPSHNRVGRGKSLPFPTLRRNLVAMRIELRNSTPCLAQKR